MRPLEHKDMLWVLAIGVAVLMLIAAFGVLR